mgnify:CR=1 FL=1
MQDIKQTLLSSFEERYKEFKEYSNFYIPYTETVKENLLNQELLNSLDTSEKIEDFMLENNLLPQYYSLDMERLKERLITSYEETKDFIEIPQEVKEEMDTIIQMKTKMIFKIVAGRPEVIDPSHIELIKSEIKKSKIIKNAVESLSK